MTDLGKLPPSVRAPLPGPVSARWVDVLARTECPALTTRRARRAERSGAPHDPIVWAEARGSNVVDADGNLYVDLTSGFGAASIGHRHPRVVDAVRSQSGRLLHALGDLYPADVKVELLDRLASIAPWDDTRVILGLGGSDAVEAALKTAMLATGRPGVVAFEGAYHGLSHGPLAACGYSAAFRAPFAAQLNPHVSFVPWPRPEQDADAALAAVEGAWPADDPGALLVEPVQGRGGVRLAPPHFLARLAELCRARGTLLVADEIFTAHGRCGVRWSSVADGVTPDLLCTGKALGGGMPVSACLGRADVMAAWGSPTGAAIHTGTFFGHPLGCAAALATLDVIEEEALPARAAERGAQLTRGLREVSARHDETVRDVRSVGLLVGVELDGGTRSLAVVRKLLERGWIVLPAGCDAEVVQIIPPLSIEPSLLDEFIAAFDAVLTETRETAT